MTARFKARYDGKALIPEGPVDIPVGAELNVEVREAVSELPEPPMLRWVRAVEDMPASGDLPSDGAAQLDHYLYGMPKKP